ncbi:MAG TPA: ABC transporter ATP-binding protein [Candidatus Nitrosopolaris sp.]|nr:ABC transporter ATP-binding protein [Candidatus Nitrosopolaris sp.]
MIKFLLKVWGLARPYRARLFLGVFTGIVSGLIVPLLVAVITLVTGAVFPSAKVQTTHRPLTWAPAFIQHAYDHVQRWSDNARQAIESGLQQHQGAILALIAIIPLIMFLRGMFSYLNVYFLQWTAIHTVADLRVRLFNHLLNLSAGFFSKNRSGELISRIMSDTSALQNVLSGATSVIIRDPVTLIGMLTLLLSSQPLLTLISMVALPVCLLPLSIYNRKVRRSSREMQTQTAGLMQVMAEAFTGHRIVKAYNLENAVATEFRKTADKTVSQYMRIIRANEISGPMIEFFGSIGVALALLYLIYHTLSQPPSASDFMELLSSIFFVYQPMKNLSRLYNQLAQARAASERVFELLATPTSVPEPAQPRPLKAAGTDIHFEHVDFAYDDKPVLRDIDLRIRPGQLVALVGSTGAGKTSVANLLLRFYDPTRGAVRIGGVDIREVATRDLRNQIAVVTQETILFNDTVRRNIEMGRPGATNEEIIAAARHAYAYDFIMGKPQGFDTIIGERGITLSGGERQRLAIARAVLKNAPILVLDEATSSLDTESERAVQAALDELMKGRATLCIAHRLSTIFHADLIVVLDQGRIVEIGKHAELIRRGGIYQKLYELSFGPEAHRHD